MPAHDLTPPYRLVWDDFKDGFRTSGPDARWHYFTMGEVAADDGVVTVDTSGLRVVSSGANPFTSEPAFAQSYGHEEMTRLGLPGVADHVKWLVHSTHQASTGFPGFDAPSSYELSFETWVSGRGHGTAGHPFEGSVLDHEDDLRLGVVAVPVVDPETLLVVTFFITNKSLYATYERLAAGRGTPALGDYASFLYAIPVARRSADERHHLKISYDRDAGRVRWSVDGEEVYRLDRLGHRLPDHKYLILDHGGTETEVRPRQLNCGMGMFTLLDAAHPDGPDAGLVQIDPDPTQYRGTDGGPEPQTFLDDRSRETSRLFGQGAELSVAQYVVSCS